MRFDAAVIGAGIVGLCTAIELRRRGLSVVLIDRKPPGREASFGNAGIIQREGLWPHLFPTKPAVLLAHALKRMPHSSYHLSGLPGLAGFLGRYWRFSMSSGAQARTIAANAALFGHVIDCHRSLAAESDADHLLRDGGWLFLYRDAAKLRADAEELAALSEQGIGWRELDATSLTALEPHIDQSRIGAAIHHEEAWSCRDPGALCDAHAARFARDGGTFKRMDVTAVDRITSGWRIGDGRDLIEADQLVVAAGIWSKDLLSGLGVRLPMGGKRGYHRHYKPRGNETLQRPCFDVEGGYVMAPMQGGLRITTGAEFAKIDAPKTPVQLAQVEGFARDVFALGDPAESEPWMGVRPCLPDMLPAIGRAPGVGNLWINTGHAHSGFMLGPLSGLLLAQQMTGEAPLVDPAHCAPDRFS